MELLVTMLVSSIMISITCLSYQIIYKQFNSYKKSIDKIVEAITFDSILKNDFLTSVKILKSSSGIALMNPEGNIISYNLSTQFIIREFKSLRDTFFLSAQNPEIKFKKNKQEFLNEYVDELYFESFFPNEKRKFHYLKQYGSDVLMEDENK